MLSQTARKTAGAMKTYSPDTAGSTPMWFTYIQLPGANAAVLRAVEFGRKILNEPVDVPKMSRMAVIDHPEGPPFGLATPISQGGR